MKVLVLSQNKVLQRFVEQILDDVVVDRVQQRLEEQDLETPRVRCGFGGAVLRREQASRPAGMEILDTIASSPLL